VNARQRKSVELVEQCLANIREHNPRVNAFITVLHDEALDAARHADAETSEWLRGRAVTRSTGRALRNSATAQPSNLFPGPLHGVPIAIKDFYDTAGVKTTGAFEHFKDRVPEKDAPAVAMLKQAGAIIVGKTNMHQLGMGTTGLESFFGPVRNPHDPDYIAGGSSSGSAAAVATGMCVATLDTDAIGSCRLPAACCGVLGFKGTYGLIPMSGILEGTQPPDEMIVWLGHAGITARSVEDIAMMLEALTEKSFAPLETDREFRVGVATNFKADAEVRNAFERAVGQLRGVSLREAKVPPADPRNLENIKEDRASVADRAFADIDLLVLPTTTTTVPRIEDARGNPQALSPENTLFANYYGLPAISVPCGIDANGLPLGFQIVGKPQDDRSVLQLARRFAS